MRCGVKLKIGNWKSEIDERGKMPTSLALSDLSQLGLQTQLVEARVRQAQEQTDAAVENQKRLAKGGLFFFRSAAHRGRVSESPVRRRRMPRPHWAHSLRSVIAEGEDEIQFRRAWLRELVPTFAAQIARWNAGEFDLSQSFGPDDHGRMAAGAIGDEVRFAPEVHDRFRHNRSRRIARA